MIFSFLEGEEFLAMGKHRIVTLLLNSNVDTVPVEGYILSGITPLARP